jgi:branched-chain amino acid aminotransferase
MEKSILIERTKTPKPKPDQSQLGFGKYFSDHMFIMDYSVERGWYDPRIIPYAPLELDPSTMVFHYGQIIFEGLKAYRTQDQRILLFRPDQNLVRLNLSNDRLCIPPIDGTIGVEAIKAIVSVDKDWVPAEEGTSLYVRPFVIPTDPYLGVRPSNTYKFIIILSPVGAYYPEGINPVKIFVEEQYVRAVKGGVGFAKTPGNYAASLKAQVEANQKGFTQVLWLDGVEKKYVEEVGTMNVFFKIRGEVITPILEGSILPGITRDSTIQLLKTWGIPVTERKISVQELYEAQAQGWLEEAFGTGTAAVISPIGELSWNDRVISINKGEIGQVSADLYRTITGIQKGTLKDEWGWIVDVK